jgi:hypothetical protein
MRGEVCSERSVLCSGEGGRLLLEALRDELFGESGHDDCRFSDHADTAATQELLAARVRRRGRAEAAGPAESEPAGGAQGWLPERELA